MQTDTLQWERIRQLLPSRPDSHAHFWCKPVASLESGITHHGPFFLFFLFPNHLASRLNRYHSMTDSWWTQESLTRVRRKYGMSRRGLKGICLVGIDMISTLTCLCSSTPPSRRPSSRAWASQDETISPRTGPRTPAYRECRVARWAMQ